ncbi:hypothetical protein [Cereibacter sphaeroides]|uniref:hypothetical protein n=1 Tax=Cereibacter sphaeroides TaxID=1063 RepID=UPI0011C3A4CC|nr:hypothetical protein [Cereibacter sphaeroides]
MRGILLADKEGAQDFLTSRSCAALFPALGVADNATPLLFPDQLAKMTLVNFMFNDLSINWRNAGKEMPWPKTARCP